MRNSYAIYDLKVPKTFQKYALKGKEMDSYFPPKGFHIKKQIDMIRKMVLSSEEQAIEHRCCCPPFRANERKHSRPVCCRDYGSNQYIAGMIYILKTLPKETVASSSIIERLASNEKSVFPISKLTDLQYDKLLEESIVFLNLVDASACNTIIECIVRNTPILVNRLPAMTEILGEDYPLFYSTLKEASKKLHNDTLIHQAHDYLCKMNKTCLTKDFFIETIRQSQICKRG
jgi:hypothetical protein